MQKQSTAHLSLHNWSRIERAAQDYLHALEESVRKGFSYPPDRAQDRRAVYQLVDPPDLAITLGLLREQQAVLAAVQGEMAERLDRLKYYGEHPGPLKLTGWLEVWGQDLTTVDENLDSIAIDLVALSPG